MNLYELLKNKDKCFTAEYFPTTDLAYNFNIKQLLDEKEDIVKYFKNCKDYKLNYDRFIDYVLCLELAKYNKDKKYISQEYLLAFESVLNEINTILKNISAMDVMNFFDDIKDLSKLDFNLQRLCYSFIKTNKNIVTKNSLKNIINIANCLIIDDYILWLDDLIKYGLYDDVLNDLEISINTRLEKILQLITNLKLKNINIEKYIIIH